MIRVALVDDQHLVRAGLRALLERAADITIVGEAVDGASGLALVAAHRPDVVLMDIRMPGIDGIEATRRILADNRLRAVHVIVLTTFDADEYVFEAIRSGAAGFLLKDTSPDDLRRAVRLVAGGDALLAPAVTRRVMQAAATRPRLADDRLAVLPIGNATSSPRSVPVGRTTTSPPGCSSARPPPAPTSAACSPSSAPAIVRSWSSSPTKPAWSPPAPPHEPQWQRACNSFYRRGGWCCWCRLGYHNLIYANNDSHNR